MGKNYREQIRTDELTEQLVLTLISKNLDNYNKISKSELYRKAIYRMAKEELSEEEFAAVVTGITDMQRI